jgi:hypothetical protein
MALSLSCLAAENVSSSTTPPPAAKSIEIKEVLSFPDGRKFGLLMNLDSPEAVADFQRDSQIIEREKKDFDVTKQLLDLALTTPEKEARTRELEAKFKKLQETNAKMAKTYNFNLGRQYLLVPTALKVLTALSNDEYTKLASLKDFKAESVITDTDGKKLLLKETIKGAVEVESFGIQVSQVNETKRGLQQLIEAQPRFTKDEEKKKIEEAIKNTQAEVNKSLEEFKKSHGYEIPNELHYQTTQAKLYTLLSDEEQKNVQNPVDGKDAKTENKSDKK